MKKQDRKNYNRLLKEENEALREILQMAEDQIEFDENLQVDYDELNHLCLELAKDLNDFAADWAEDHKDYKETLINLVEKNTRACDENVRLQSKIAVAEKEKTKLAIRNERLSEDLDTAEKINKELKNRLNEFKDELYGITGNTSL